MTASSIEAEGGTGPGRGGAQRSGRLVVTAVLFLTAVDAMGVWFFLDGQQQADTLQ